MKPATPAAGWRATPIRVRLGLALAAALAPVLILSAIQSALEFKREAQLHRTELASAAERSAATARARIASGEVILQTLAPASIGFQCAPRLAEIRDRIPGYANLIRFDAIGRVACAAATAPPDPDRRNRPWFRALESGAPISIASDAGAAYADQPALLASVRAEDQEGHFAGALSAVITLASLRPQTIDRSLPDQSDVALADSAGHLLSTTHAWAFPGNIHAHLRGAALTGPALWFGTDRQGASRVFSSAPLVGQDVYVVLSAPSQGLVSWARLNPVSAIVLPLLAFLLPLLAVMVVAERGVVRWITYLRRIAAIYARGRYSVHPWRAEAAPPEIRTLAQTLDTMARTIAARDAALNETLVQKEDLMREIHHRVKNNLQIVSSLLNLQQRALVDTAARAALSDSRQRIGALALIYRSLYEGPSLNQVNLRHFLEELIAQTIRGDSIAAAPVRTELEIDDLVIDADRLAPLSLFAVEAITNANKHGLSKAGGKLCVTLRVEAGEAVLKISDTGVAGVAAEIGQGVGRTLMTAFARQLRGDVAFIPNAGGGMTAQLSFPTLPPHGPSVES